MTIQGASESFHSLGEISLETEKHGVDNQSREENGVSQTPDCSEGSSLVKYSAGASQDAKRACAQALGWEGENKKRPRKPAGRVRLASGHWEHEGLRSFRGF